MKRSETRDFIKRGINQITPSIAFGSGRISEFASLSTTFPASWLESLERDSEIPFLQFQESWPIKLHIRKLDSMDSSADQYEAIVDECDLIAQQLMRLYNEEISGYDRINLSSIKSEPMIKRDPECSTGVLLTFTISGPDSTNLC